MSARPLSRTFFPSLVAMACVHNSTSPTNVGRYFQLIALRMLLQSDVVGVVLRKIRLAFHILFAPRPFIIIKYPSLCISIIHCLSYLSWFQYLPIFLHTARVRPRPYVQQLRRCGSQGTTSEPYSAQISLLSPRCRKCRAGILS